MFSQYFGNYLLNRGLLSRQQLIDTLEFQQSVHVKLGVMAVDLGYMTPVQVEEVHEKQKQVDKRFGEIAVELGYLTNEQIELMLASQKQDYLLLAQALVDRKYMTIEQFSNALNDYKIDYDLSDEQFESIKSGNIEPLVESLLNRIGAENKDFYVEYLSLFAKNMVRFIDDQIYLEVSNIKSFLRGEWFVKQEIIGGFSLETSLSAMSSVFLQVASVYAEEELSAMDELAQASVSEFLNLHNGIFLVNQSNKGIALDMRPPKVAQNIEVDDKALFVTVHLSKGSFQLALSK